MAKIVFKRGPKDRLPEKASVGEPLFTTDTHELFMGTGKDSPIKKIGKQTKDINVICSRPQQGTHFQYAKFKYSGTIKNIDAYCGIPGDKITEINIEKISEDDFINGIDNWTTILSNNIFIYPNQTTNDGTYELNNTEVNENDLFRLVFVQAGKLQKLTVQIQIELN